MHSGFAFLSEGWSYDFFSALGANRKGNTLTLGMEGLSAPKGSMLMLSAKMFEDAAIGWNYNYE